MRNLPYTGSLICSALALVLLVVNVSLANSNRSRQAEIAVRQNEIVNGQALAQLNQALIQAMAESSIKNGDTQLRDLLSSQGITLKTDKK